MPDQLLRSAYIAAEGPLALNGETLIGIIVKDTYVFSTAHENASEVTAYEVEPVSTESRLTGTCTVILNDAETAWLPLVTDTTAVDLSDVEDRGGIVWVRPGASDAVRKIIGWAADPGPDAAAYLPTWPDGLYAELIAPFDAMSADSTVAGVPFVDGDVDAEDLAAALAAFIGSGGTTVRPIDKTGETPGVVNIDLSTGADAVADDVAVVAITGPSGGDCEFVVTPPFRSNGLALGIYAYCPGHFATITIPASGPLDEVSYGPVVVPVVELVGGALAQTPASGGGGAVDSVNGQTGVVVLDADDIGDGTTNKAYTAAEQSKLAAITGTNTGDQTLPTLSSLGAVPTSRTLAGLDLSADRTASALRTALGLVIGTDVAAQSSLAAKADLASPALTGTPTAPTPAAGTNTTQVATTAFVAAGSAPKFVTASPATLTNKWLTPGVIVNGAGTLALAAGFAYYEPWVVLAPITIDALGISVFTGAAAGKLLRLALFNAGARWAPTGAAVVTTSTLAADVAANTRVVGTFSSVTIAPGMYVAAYISDGAPTVRTLLGEPITGTLRSNDASNQLMNYFYDGSGSRNWVSAGFPSSPTMVTGSYSQVAFQFAMDCREA